MTKKGQVSKPIGQEVIKILVADDHSIVRQGIIKSLASNFPDAEFGEAANSAGAAAYMTPSLAALITNELRQDHDKHSHEILSDREYQVLLLIGSGKSVSIIAQELSLSVKTISVYRSNILKKMNLKNNSEITHYAFKHELIA